MRGEVSEELEAILTKRRKFANDRFLFRESSRMIFCEKEKI